MTFIGLWMFVVGRGTHDYFFCRGDRRMLCGSLESVVSVLASESNAKCVSKHVAQYFLEL